MRRIIMLVTVAVVMSAMMALSGMAWATPASDHAPAAAQQKAQCNSGNSAPVFPPPAECPAAPPG
jgi:hypothetical protein